MSDIFVKLISKISGANNLEACLNKCEMTDLSDILDIDERSLLMVEDFIRQKCLKMSEKERETFVDNTFVKRPDLFKFAPGVRERLFGMVNGLGKVFRNNTIMANEEMVNKFGNNLLNKEITNTINIPAKRLDKYLMLYGSAFGNIKALPQPMNNSNNYLVETNKCDKTNKDKQVNNKNKEEVSNAIEIENSNNNYLTNDLIVEKELDNQIIYTINTVKVQGEKEKEKDNSERINIGINENKSEINEDNRNCTEIEICNNNIDKSVIEILKESTIQKETNNNIDESVIDKKENTIQKETNNNIDESVIDKKESTIQKETNNNIDESKNQNSITHQHQPNKTIQKIVYDLKPVVKSCAIKEKSTKNENNSRSKNKINLPSNKSSKIKCPPQIRQIQFSSKSKLFTDETVKINSKDKKISSDLYNIYSRFGDPALYHTIGSNLWNYFYRCYVKPCRDFNILVCDYKTENKDQKAYFVCHLCSYLTERKIEFSISSYGKINFTNIYNHFNNHYSIYRRPHLKRKHILDSEIIPAKTYKY